MANNVNTKECIKIATEIDQVITAIRVNAIEQNEKDTIADTYKLESLTTKLGFYAGCGAALNDKINAYVFEGEES